MNNQNFNNRNNYNPNQALQEIIGIANNGGNPQMLMQALMQKNPKYNQAMEQIKNMANGMPMNEFVMQLAKQRGIDPNTLSQLQRLINGNR